MLKKQVQSYKSNEISTAGKLKLVIMMYDGVIRYLKECKNRIKKGDIAGMGLYLSKAQRIIDELQESLNTHGGGDVAKNLGSLYKYIATNLTKANINGNTVPIIDESINILENLRQSWREVLLSSPKGAEQSPDSQRITIQL